jgi:S-DNA-T family DNA segregation ATPase FtsK/SpoIIIE
MSAVTFSEDGRPADRSAGFRAWIAQKRHERDLYWTTQEIKLKWREVATGAGVGRRVLSGAGMPVDVWPEVTHVHFSDDGLVLVVRLLAGQLPADVASVARRMAYGMGCAQIRVKRFRQDWIKVHLLASDPLETATCEISPVPSALSPIALGVDEAGELVLLDWVQATHMIVQGTTGGGKSTGMYSLLAQHAGVSDARITGCDPTGLLLRPWIGHWDDVPAAAVGSKNPMAFVTTVDQLVREMDRRISEIPPDRDSVILGPELPVIVCVLEEYPGLLRILDSASKELGKTFRALVGRLFAEGRKGGIRLVVISQRADATIIGGFERGQASHTMSYRVDSADAVRMLHPDVTADLVAEHASAPAGVALLSRPGNLLTRLRAPYLTYASYIAYSAAVRDQEPPRAA